MSHRFLGIVGLKAGDAQHIFSTLLQFLVSDVKVPLEKMVGFGSDGAAVMVGSKGGVATLLKQQVSDCSL